MQQKKLRIQLSSFAILFLILVMVGLVSQLLANQPFTPQMMRDSQEMVSHVVGAKVSNIVMAPYEGFKSAIDISIFILTLGGFLNIIMQSGALEAGMQKVVKKLRGNELLIIPVLMILFSIGGSAYGMSEETLPFYGLLAATMVAAGFDTMVAFSTIMLGTGSGLIGATVNPFATGVARDALASIGIETNVQLTLIIGAAIWLLTTSYTISVVMRYAKKVKADKGSTILSLQEQAAMHEAYGHKEIVDPVFTKRQKIVLLLFAFSFVVMILSLIPWPDFGITFFSGWTNFLTGNNFGEWYFGDLAMWFFIMGMIIAIVCRYSQNEIISYFIDGCKDLLSVVFIIVIARGVSVLMSQTHLDLYILDQSAHVLKHLSPVLFVIVAYLLYILLSFVIPSSSGLAYVSIPVMGALAQQVGLSTDVMIMIFTSACGLTNLVTPTSAVLMGGVQVCQMNYTTWLKFIRKPMLIIALLNLAVLVTAMLLS